MAIESDIQGADGRLAVKFYKYLQEDIVQTLAEGRPEADAIKNATDSALRGYTVGQWPEEINKALAYNPNQLKTLDALKMYMITGKAPVSRKEFIEQQINTLPE